MIIMNTKILLGKRIKEIRKLNHLTQEKLAEMVDLETTSLSGIESGRHYPSLPTIEKIAKNLNVEIAELFNFNHLQTTDELKDDILNKIDKLDDEKLKFIYEFITKFTI